MGELLINSGRTVGTVALLALFVLAVAFLLDWLIDALLAEQETEAHSQLSGSADHFEGDAFDRYHELSREFETAISRDAFESVHSQGRNNVTVADIERAAREWKTSE